jgi:hypothetical protein
MTQFRNFWVRVDVEGWTNDIGTGPRGDADGMAIAIDQLSDGDPVYDLVRVHCVPEDDGRLRTDVYVQGSVVATVTTWRDAAGIVIGGHPPEPPRMG